MGPWSPNWRPDPTGRRLAAMRVARRGGLLAALIFTPLVALTVELTPIVPGLDDANWVIVSISIALSCAPGLALLGAALAGSTVGDRVDAVVTGVAMAVGVPVAAVVSAIIGAFVVVAFKFGVGDATDFIGTLLRAGVTGGLRITPLIALGAATWVVLVRRFGRALIAPTT
jgi:RsiW-degrading membrane proteinase PrsW (M82 family)